MLSTCLILHGGEGSSSERTVCLATNLSRRGVKVVSFDFEGQGKSGGTLLGSSLQRRFELAVAVAEHALASQVDAVLGFSMGAQTAVDLFF
jgi:alpha-beta hydrolase superfamily lysophospholipase